MIGEKEERAAPPGGPPNTACTAEKRTLGAAEPARAPWARWAAVDLRRPPGSDSRCQRCFFPFPPHRDLVRKLLVVDRTRRLGNMKVGACVPYTRWLRRRVPVTGHGAFPPVGGHRSTVFPSIVSRISNPNFKIQGGRHPISSSPYTQMAQQ